MKHFRASNGLPVTFISSYSGTADYGVYVRRLGYDVRVHRDQATGTLLCSHSDATAAEREACKLAVAEYLAAEHAAFLAWQAARV